MGRHNDLKDEIPKDTIIRVLLRKIKIQEGIIADLEDELAYYNHPHRFLDVLSDMSEQERMRMRRNPYYLKCNAKYAELERKFKELKKERDVMYNIINDYVSRLY